MHLVVLGDMGVGKTALTVQYCANTFVPDYDPTIEDSFRKQVIVDGITELVDILDTAGEEEFAYRPTAWLRGCSGALLLYSITSARSFDQLASYIQVVHDLHGKRYPCVIVGCKSDLEHTRQVELARAQELGELLGYPVIETSAKYKINVDEAFAALLRLRREYDNLQPLAKNK